MNKKRFLGPYGLRSFLDVQNSGASAEKSELNISSIALPDFRGVGTLWRAEKRLLKYLLV